MQFLICSQSSCEIREQTCKIVPEPFKGRVIQPRGVPNRKGSDTLDAAFEVYPEQPREASIGLGQEEVSVLRFLSGFSSFSVFQNSEKRNRAQ
jgi:hypothetical protein